MPDTAPDRPCPILTAPSSTPSVARSRRRACSRRGSSTTRRSSSSSSSTGSGGTGSVSAGPRRRPTAASTSSPRSPARAPWSCAAPRRAARLPQRLPPSRLDDPRGELRQARPDPVPVPRLDLRPRRPAPAGEAHGRPRRLRARRELARPRPLRDLAGVRVPEPRPGGPPAARHPRGPARPLRALRLRLAPPRPADHLRGRRELEGDRRELLRVLPLPGDPSPAQPPDAVRHSCSAAGWHRVSTASCRAISVCR